MVFFLVGRQVLHQRNLAQPGNAVQRGRIDLLEQSAKDAHFALAQSNVLIEFLLPDNRLLNSPDRLLAGHLRHLNRHLHAHFVIRVHVRSNVDVHADVQVRKLRIHQRVHEARTSSRTNAHARLKAAGSDRDTVTDVQLGRLPIHRANLGVLDNLRVCIG